MKRFSLLGAPLLALALLLTVAGGSALAQDSTIDVELGEWYVNMPTTIPAGPLTLNIMNEGAMVHTLAIEGEGVNLSLDQNLSSGQSATMQIDLEPGTYTFLCPIPGHPEAGMVTEVTVQAAQADPTPTPAEPDPTPTPAEPAVTPTPAEPAATPTPGAPAATPTPLPGPPATGMGGGSSDGNTTLIMLLAIAAGVAVVGGGLYYGAQRRAG